MAEFKREAVKVGIRQFFIQAHIQSAMEITAELKRAVSILQSAGWIVTNQLVFTAASSRRGHTSKLRKVLNDLGIVPYYTFSVKGFMENYHNFATSARSVQEMNEEKVFGFVPNKDMCGIMEIPKHTEKIKQILKNLRKDNNLLFVSADRSVLNLPGVGKSATFRSIGITNDGRRILEFEYDQSRQHSPAINTIGKVIIVESKSILKYLGQMEEMGEKRSEYCSIWGYSVNVTERVMPIYKYPEFEYQVTKRFTNIKIENNN